MANLLEVKNLRTCFYQENKSVAVVDDVSFGIDENSVMGLVGESGCGKTMTALSLTRLLPVSGCRIERGEVVFAKRNIIGLPDEELRKIRGKDITYVFQEPSTALNPVLRVKEQIEEVVRLHRRDISHDKIIPLIISHLEEVGINQAKEKINFYPHQLSGGEKQRVMLAMSMICRPKLLIADEPTTALDVTVQAQILELLLKLKNEYGLSVLFISHDLNVVAQLSDYLAVMYAGQIVEYLNTKNLVQNIKHPYSRGLFGCLPQLHADKRKRLNIIPGDVPRPEDFPQGCRFHPRCREAFELCRKSMPPVIKIENIHEVRCWLYSNLKT